MTQRSWIDSFTLTGKNLSGRAQMLILLTVTVPLIVLLELVSLPAAVLLGALLAALIMSAFQISYRVPSLWFMAGQSLVGCMIARSMPPAIFSEVFSRWPLFLATVFSVIIVCAIMSSYMTRRQWLPGTTAVWGLSPGAATAMTLMAESYGADTRLVAVMQYLRVAMAVIVASLVSRFWHPAVNSHSAGMTHAADAFNLQTLSPWSLTAWFPPVDWWWFMATVLLSFGTAYIGKRLKIPAGAMLVPLFVAIGLQAAGLITLTLPPWLLAISYLLVGWNIGLRFTRDVLRYAAHVLPRLVLAIGTLVAACAGFAWVLVNYAGIDPLTAYLATSPGGADSVAIIAASSQVDLPFVMALQTARFIIVLLTGPAIARLITRYARPANAKVTAGNRP